MTTATTRRSLPAPTLEPGLASPAASLAAARCLDLEGKSVRLRDSFAGRTTVVALVRQFGCLFCHEIVAELIAGVDRLERRGAHVVIVGSGSIAQATRFAQHKGLPRAGVTLLTDPALATYDAAQLQRSWIATFLHPSAWDAYGRARRAGHEITGAFGDTPQLGGIFVIKPPAELLFEHRSRFAGDHPTMDAIVDACGPRARTA